MLKAFSKTLDEGNFTFVIGMKLFRAAYTSIILPNSHMWYFLLMVVSPIFWRPHIVAFKFHGLTKNFTGLIFPSFTPSVLHISSQHLHVPVEDIPFLFSNQKIFYSLLVGSSVMCCFVSKSDRMDNLKFGQCPLLLVLHDILYCLKLQF